MAKIIKKILEENLSYDNTVILKYHIEYPYIDSGSYLSGVEKFNTYNKELALELKNKIEKQLYKDAINTYKYNKEHGYPTMVYEVYKSLKITLNRGQLVSLYLDEYMFSGGAHGNTVRTSQTWNLGNGKIIKLYELFKEPYFLLEIFKSIDSQIRDNADKYFEDACSLVLETFNPQNYYLTTEKEVIIYFQEYDIAPYSSGIPIFEVTKFDK